MPRNSPALFDAAKPLEPKAAAVRNYCRLRGYPVPVAEYVFARPRLWRFDLAWPDDPTQQVALEFEGGVWTRGRHSRGAGMEADMQKYAEAALRGWLVLRCSPGMLKRGDVFGWLDRLWGR